jgi:hypothetical protein
VTTATAATATRAAARRPAIRCHAVIAAKNAAIQYVPACGQLSTAKLATCFLLITAGLNGVSASGDSEWPKYR